MQIHILSSAHEMMILLLSFLHCFAAVSGGKCDKFMDLSLLTYNAQRISNTGNGASTLSRELGVLKEYQFNCSTTSIISLILGIDVLEVTGNYRQFPTVQIFRPSQFFYNLVTGSERTIYYSTSNVSTSGVFEYPLDPPISVMRGDLLAVSQPYRYSSVIRIYYLTSSGVSFTSSRGISFESKTFPTSISSTNNYFILVYPVTDGYCVKSSHSITSSVIYSNTLKIRRTLFINDAYQYLYPDLVFSCNGTIGKWIFGARPGEDDESRLPEFQIWRQVGPVRYVKAASSLARGSTKIGTNLYEFTPQAPLLFKEGEMFGIFVPSRDDARIVLYEQEASGPTNLRVSANRPLSTRDGALSTVAYNDFPLITAEYSIILEGTTSSVSHVVSWSTLQSHNVTGSVAKSSSPISSCCYITSMTVNGAISTTPVSLVTNSIFTAVTSTIRTTSFMTVSSSSTSASSTRTIVSTLSMTVSSTAVSTASVIVSSTDSTEGQNYMIPIGIAMGAVVLILTALLVLVIIGCICFLNKRKKYTADPITTHASGHSENNIDAATDEEPYYSTIEDVYDDIVVVRKTTLATIK